MFLTVLKQDETGAYHDDSEKLEKLLSEIKPFKNLLDQDDDDIVEVYFSNKGEACRSELTVAYFYGWSAAQNNGTPLYSHTVSSSGETISEVFAIDTETTRELFTWTSQQVLSEVIGQMIEARDPAYDDAIWFEHSTLGKSCFYGDVDELI